MGNMLSSRRIAYDLPKQVFEQSGERYLDAETGYLIATMKADLYNKTREVMVRYPPVGGGRFNGRF